jgi:hypothetical protein
MTETWEQALSLMRESLSLLDEGSAPHDIGAHLDLAICKLEEALRIGREAGADGIESPLSDSPMQTRRA